MVDICEEAHHTRLKKVKQLQQDGFQYHLVALTEEGAAAKFAKD